MLGKMRVLYIVTRLDDFDKSWQQICFAKEPQIIGNFLCKNCFGYFWGNFWKNWATFSATSGHTVVLPTYQQL